LQVLLLVVVHAIIVQQHGQGSCPVAADDIILCTVSYLLKIHVNSHNIVAHNQNLGIALSKAAKGFAGVSRLPRSRHVCNGISPNAPQCLGYHQMPHSAWGLSPNAPQCLRTITKCPTVLEMVVLQHLETAAARWSACSLSYPQACTFYLFKAYGWMFGTTRGRRNDAWSSGAPHT